jgi:hypothetical protein
MILSTFIGTHATNLASAGLKGGAPGRTPGFQYLLQFANATMAMGELPR